MTRKYFGLLLTTILSILVVCCAYGVAENTKTKTVSAKEVGSDNRGVSTNQPQAAVDSRHIIPGQGTSQIFIGMTRDELIRVLGNPSTEYNHKGHCTYSEMHWFPEASPSGKVDGDGVFAFLTGEKTFELRFGKGYQTKDGIEIGWSLDNLKAKIKAPIFRLNPSANTATNDEDLWFLVERETGIAYELGAGYKTKKRGVSAIYVFKASTDFVPWGCISENQNFVKINSTE